MSAEDQREDSFISHLVELRSRLLRAVVAVMLVFLALLPFAQWLYRQIAEPLLAVLPEGGQLIAIDVASPFFAPLKLTFVVAVMVSMPIVLYQLWAFVAPGLYQHEQRLARPLLYSASLLFYSGCAFAWFFVLPTVFGFLSAMTPEGVAMMTDINRYLDFVLVIFLAFGFCFEVPVAVVILRTLGWVDDAQLREARPYVIVGAFVIAAVLTPPDVVSQLLLAIPMCLLYECGLIAARWLGQRPRETASS
ncbi:twin-arginine translocase subunit TatC [Pseudomarimonas salicorniae]|uniref:Sec-independent protein translocase protein TatC n=1 Tax=Pseudomarimonas salicorniae TaxID=2933270 RepID=A0ABT0GIN2_9GAMM|nr:twin-arginine translocase subunit TatC [Lysobacter sp. CAU 1642]MCK7594414.1 twin-arginine translocase subunit TatC [Lysobacter sp. CAU 1642]